MNNRQFTQVLFNLIAGGPLVLCSTTAAAYTQFQARDALRQSLQAGSNFAVKQLGTLYGFWGSEKVRIPLAAFLEQGRRLLKRSISKNVWKRCICLSTARQNQLYRKPCRC